MATSISGVATPDTLESNAQSQPAKDDTPQEVLDPSIKAVLDQDVEPHELSDRYVKLKTLLHERRPDLTEVQPRPKKKVKGRPPEPPEKPGLNVSRLLRGIARLESDMLFDLEEGRRLWAEARLRLLKEEVAKKREIAKKPPALELQGEGKECEDPAMPIPEPEEGPGLDLGDFFASLPEETSNGMVITSEEGESVTIRSFGKWSGVTPRRVLEDSCKARDSSYQIKYTVISLSSFSVRHSLSLSWSRAQEIPEPNTIPGIDCLATERNVLLQMKQTSASDSKESEALVSVAALFYVFGSSPKEEKAHLKLSPVFREYWAELAELKSRRKMEEDKDEVKYVRKMLDLPSENGQVNGDQNAQAGPAKSDEKVDAQKTHIAAMTREQASAESLSALWAAKSSMPAYQRMLGGRMNLPIWSFKHEILDALADNQVIIICGETGCGKSTQVPSFIVEQCLSNGQDCKIYCTEPRRISAISLARRVSEELGERKNDIGTRNSLIGFAIRLESQISASTRLVYATTGIVMRMLEHGNGLEGITHLVLDEVHERNIDSDFLLIILRKIMAKRPALKVILMSATVNAEQFSRYLNGAPILNVPGRTFPVETKFLEDAIELTGYRSGSKSAYVVAEAEAADDQPDDAPQTTSSTDLQSYSSRTRSVLSEFNEYRIDYDLICQLLETIATKIAYYEYSKAILVFLPGLAEIRRLYDLVSTHPTFLKAWIIFPLHSTVATEEQERVFLTPPHGMRKIVLATNIAETGITIPDVTCVIDTGKHKEMRFDEKRQLSRLIESFIAQANAKQRRGRAGRVQNGLCFHLFTRARFEGVMPEQQTPEMLRLSLQDLALRVKLCKLGAIEETLGEALDPPLPRNVRRAVDSLIDVKALTQAEELTTLGRQLAKLPLDVYLGKLIILSSIFRCVDAGLTMAALLSSKSPFIVPVGARQQADTTRLGFKKGNSDLLTAYNAYCAWRRICKDNSYSEANFCRKSFLSSQTLSNIEELKAQLAMALHDAGFLVLSDHARAALSRVRSAFRQRQFVEIPAPYDAHSANDLVTTSVIAWSFYPKLLRAEGGRSWRNVANNQLVTLFPTSVNRSPTAGDPRPPKWLSFYHIMQASSRAYHAHETSAAEDLAVALNCGEADFRTYAGVVVIDGNRVRFAVPDWTGMLVLKNLRRAIREIVAQGIKSPGKQLSETQEAWFEVWQAIFTRTQEKS